MKNSILKIFTPLIFIAGIYGCSQHIAVGNWENIQKNPDSTTVTTNLTINQIGQEYNASMETKLDGKESENLQLPVKSVKFSGHIYGKRLDIDEVESDSSDLSYNSSLVVSDNGKTLTLNPGKIKFQKK
jgi:hypothetical protein